MNIKTRFVVTSITPSLGANAEAINIGFHAVQDESKEHKAIFQTGEGAAHISLVEVAPEVAKTFEEGQEYYVEFTPAEKDFFNATTSTPK